MLKFIRYILWAAVAFLALFLAYQQFFHQPKAPPASALRIDQFTPPIAGVDYSAHPMTVVNFFASWCVPCRAEHPLLLELASQTAVIGIAWKDKPDDTAKFLEELGSPFIKTVSDPTGQDSRAWRIEGIPATFVVDTTGQIRYRRIGVLLDKHLTQIQQIIIQ